MKRDGSDPCAFAARAIEELGDGKWSRPRLRGLKKHLEECPECRGYYNRMRVLLAVLERMPRIEAPPGFAEGVLELALAVGELNKAGGEQGRRRPLLLVAGAAAFGIAVALAVAAVKRLASHGGIGEAADDMPAYGRV